MSEELSSSNTYDVREGRRLILKAGGLGLLLGVLGLANACLPPEQPAKNSSLEHQIQVHQQIESLEPPAEEPTIETVNPGYEQQNLQAYNKTREEIERKRREFSLQYSAVNSAQERKAILNQAREYIFEKIVDFLIPAWYGTPWEFSGASQTPREGTISCGYFISTILKHAGFNVERIRMAQQASEDIIKSLTGDIGEIRRYSNIPLTRFVADTESRGPGLYVAGLDCHVGFIVKEEGESLRFCHADYYHPEIGVKCQTAQERSPLVDSKYRVVGKIFDDNLMEKWLRGEAIKTVITERR